MPNSETRGKECYLQRLELGEEVHGQGQWQEQELEAQKATLTALAYEVRTRENSK